MKGDCRVVLEKLVRKVLVWADEVKLKNERIAKSMRVRMDLELVCLNSDDALKYISYLNDTVS
ncbi:MAG: hypothetical protein CFE25_18300 [Chitinophagaceae bacterium BSSC1]|nr:MAG: hypothetical protein CFE25_18300 [Chitinophagaceae bacterium BSSC1]